MPASTVSLTVTSMATPLTNPYSAQVSTAAGNSFANSNGDVMLLVQNQTATARTITWVADKFGAERTIGTSTAVANTVENGITIFGPFDPAIFNNHDTTDATKTGHVMLTHNGSNSDLVFCPIIVRRK